VGPRLHRAEARVSLKHRVRAHWLPGNHPRILHSGGGERRATAGSIQGTHYPERFDHVVRHGASAVVAANAEVGARTAFIRRTYAHVAGALIAFVALLFWYILSLFLSSRD
jgi:hypothetical protein